MIEHLFTPFFFRRFATAIVLFILGTLVYWLKPLTLIFVKEVVIEGNQEVVSDLTLFKKKRTILFFSTKKLSAEILRVFPWVEQVEIERRFPNVLYLKIRQRDPIGYTRLNGQPVFLDREGKLLPPLDHIDNLNLPYVNCIVAERTGEYLKDPKLIHSLFILEQLNHYSDTKLLELHCADKDTMVLNFSLTKVIFISQQKAEDVVASLQFLFNQFRIEGKWPKTVDLRYSKPVLIPQSDKESTEEASEQY